ncbi:MAG: TIGR03619 family F420-dependent LLM class oxidoreductase, partial [Pseudomonadota bacterium]
MKIGFFGIGIGLAADPEVAALVARSCDEAGYHSLWVPEHIVLLEQYSSKYPYAESGRMPFPSTEVDLLDPFAALNFAAAITKNIRLGTGICLVPERRPLELAKEVASIDKLSGGRFDFGVGIGWLKEEFEALEIPWERRPQRTRDYLAAMQSLWTDTDSSHQGEFCSFSTVKSFPKPVQK